MSNKFPQLHQEERKKKTTWMQAGNPLIHPPPGQIHKRNPYVRILAFDPPVKPAIPPASWLHLIKWRVRCTFDVPKGTEYLS